MPPVAAAASRHRPSDRSRRIDHAGSLAEPVMR